MSALPSRPEDPYNAFTDDDVRVAGADSGPLGGLCFGAKDLYDVAGHVTRAGSPSWAESHPQAAETAPALSALLAAGADLVAKTHTDELAWSLLGQNAHYGTPTNPRSPDRVPGGSSSGSVVAVAGGLVDFAVGSDTGGSVRVPASNCGVYGIRTTHGAISLANVVPLAPSFDTVGWFAREPKTLARVGEILLADRSESGSLADGLVAREAFEIADEAVVKVLGESVAKLSVAVGPLAEEVVASDGLAAWADAWRTIQAREVWATHGAWVDAERPDFGPGIRERFEWARSLDEETERRARTVQAEATERLLMLTDGGRVILVPAAPSVAPLLIAGTEELEQYRTRAMMLTSAAGLAGLPQISIPAGEVEGCPVAIGVIGPRGSDLALIRLACDLAERA